MVRKILRGFGYGVCIILFALCIFMIIISAVFGSEGLVGFFGWNLYLCEESGFEGLNSGAAVIVEQCEPYDITEGNLILYTEGNVDEEPVPRLGYTESITMSDGVYSIGVSDPDGNTAVISESAFVGRAGWSSDFLGIFISFSLSPWGICVMAVLPCAALMIFSFIRSYADSRPLPEVTPLVKNAEEDKPQPQTGISVKPDGKAEYSRASGAKAPQTADNVLFSYGSTKRNAVTKPAPRNVASHKNNVQRDLPPVSSVKPDTGRKTTLSDILSDGSAPKTTERRTVPPTKQEAASGGVPSSVAAKRYLDSAVQPPKKSPATAKPVAEATAEIPQLPKKKKSDAFFTQSDAPQIGRGINRKGSAARRVIDLEDALASAGRDIVPSAVGRSSADGSTRKSADILAAKSRSSLMTDDDDSRDRSRYDVDDILADLAGLAGIDRRNS